MAIDTATGIWTKPDGTQWKQGTGGWEPLATAQQPVVPAYTGDIASSTPTKPTSTVPTPTTQPVAQTTTQPPLVGSYVSGSEMGSFPSRDGKNYSTQVGADAANRRWDAAHPTGGATGTTTTTGETTQTGTTGTTYPDSFEYDPGRWSDYFLAPDGTTHVYTLNSMWGAEEGKRVTAQELKDKIAARLGTTDPNAPDSQLPPYSPTTDPTTAGGTSNLTEQDKQTQRQVNQYPAGAVAKAYQTAMSDKDEYGNISSTASNSFFSTYGISINDYRNYINHIGGGTAGGGTPATTPTTPTTPAGTTTNVAGSTTISGDQQPQPLGAPELTGATPSIQQLNVMTADQILEQIRRGALIPSQTNAVWTQMYQKDSTGKMVATQAQREAYAKWDAIQKLPNPVDKASIQGVAPEATEDNAKWIKDETIPAPDRTVSNKEIFPNYTKKDEETGLDTLNWNTILKQSGLDKYESDMESYNKQILDLNKQRAERSSQLAIQTQEIRDNPWINQTSLDKRVSVAEARANDDLNTIKGQMDGIQSIQKQITEEYNTKKSAINDFIDNTVKIENLKRQRVQDQLAAEKSIRDDSKALISTMTDALGAQGLSLIPDQLWANAGFGNIDKAALASAITEKEAAELSKNLDNPFSAWLDAYNRGDQAGMDAIEQYNTALKTAGTSTSDGSWLLGGKSLDVSGDLGDKTVPKELLTNCVLYVRSRVPDLPMGLVDMASKRKIINSYTPTPGAVGIQNTGAYGHVFLVTEVSADGKQMKIQESNYEGATISNRGGKWISTSVAEGFYISPNLSNTKTNSYPNIDNVFEKKYLYMKSNPSGMFDDMSPMQKANWLVGELTQNTSKAEAKKIEEYIRNKFSEKEIIWNKLPTTTINKLLQTFKPFIGDVQLPTGVNLPGAKYPLSDKAPKIKEETRTEIVRDDLIKNAELDQDLLMEFRNYDDAGVMDYMTKTAPYKTLTYAERQSIIDSVRPSTPFTP